MFVEQRFTTSVERFLVSCVRQQHLYRSSTIKALRARRLNAQLHFLSSECGNVLHLANKPQSIQNS